MEEVKVGDVVWRETTLGFVDGYVKLQKGIVDYVHPKRRYHRVVFQHGIRERFWGVEK